ncbi:DUF3429 domain-containing protein [Roseomonas elaeocarpi]|uniref:DUF3429 domain-containing protein n=1 Tax=Roseomonas elaeocarpi TaxID=907779 RepID=A0ABV6JXT5_9PROT
MDTIPTHLAAGTEDPQTRTPLVSLVLAYAAMIPVVVGAVAVWLLPAQAPAILRVTLILAGALLCFFSGVRRGLSFRQPGGPTLTQLATTILFFGLGFASLLSPWPLVSVLILLAGYLAMIILDPIAARRGEAPRYFSRLRPVQLLLPIASLASLLIRLLG